MTRRKIGLMFLITMIAYTAGIFTIEALKFWPEPEIKVVESFFDEIALWRLDRVHLETPYESVFKISRDVSNTYDFGDVFVDFTIRVFEYKLELLGESTHFALWFQTVGNAHVRDTNGFIHSLLLNFSRTDAYATLYTSSGSFWDPELYNLRMSEIKKEATPEEEAYVKARGLSNPKNVLVKMPLLKWDFADSNGDHWITASFSVVYFNGTVYQRAIVPIRLGMTVDDNNDMNSAETINPGRYEAFLGLGDNEDYYKVWIEGSNQVLDVILFIGASNFDLELLDSGGRVLESSKNGSYVPRFIKYQTSATGFFYIKVLRNSGAGIYSLEVRL